MQPRGDLAPVLPFVLECAPDREADRAHTPGRLAHCRWRRLGKGPKPFDGELALHAKSLADVDALVVDVVPRPRDRFRGTEHAAQVMRLGLADVAEDVVQGAAALGFRVERAIVDAADERD